MSETTPDPARRAGAHPGGIGRRGIRPATLALPDGVHGPRDRPAGRLGRLVRHPVGDLRASTRPAPRSRAATPSCPTAPARRAREPASTSRSREQLQQLWTSVPNGLYGIENARGNVDPFNEGFLYGSAMIFLFVLAVGAFVSVTMQTEAIQTGIGRLALRFKHSGSILVIVLMSIFALGGTTYGMWEETLGLLRPARAPGARAQLRPAGRGVDHLPRRRDRRARLDGQPVRDRRRVRRRRHRRRRRDRPARADVGRPRRPGDRLRAALLPPDPADPSKSIVGISPADAEESTRPGRGRADADRAPEGHPGRLLPRLRDHDLRLRPVGRRDGHGLRRRAGRSRPSRPSTSPSRRWCSSSPR